MGIGTSMGAYYDDAFHHEAAKWDPKYDNNEITPNDMRTNKELDKVDMTELGGINVSLKDMPFPANYNPELDFNNRFTNIDTNTSNLTPEDLSRLALANHGVDDRTNETMADQLAATGSALKQWGHNLIHPDSPESIPSVTPLAEELGVNSISVDTSRDIPRDLQLYWDKLQQDVSGTKQILSGMYDGLTK